MRVWIAFDGAEVEAVSLEMPQSEGAGLYDVLGAEGKVLVEQRGLRWALEEEHECRWHDCLFAGEDTTHSGTCPLREDGDV